MCQWTVYFQITSLLVLHCSSDINRVFSSVEILCKKFTPLLKWFDNFNKLLTDGGESLEDVARSLAQNDLTKFDDLEGEFSVWSCRVCQFAAKYLIIFLIAQFLDIQFLYVKEPYRFWSRSRIVLKNAWIFYA